MASLEEKALLASLRELDERSGPNERRRLLIELLECGECEVEVGAENVSPVLTKQVRRSLDSVDYSSEIDEEEAEMAIPKELSGGISETSMEAAEVEKLVEAKLDAFHQEMRCKARNSIDQNTLQLLSEMVTGTIKLI